MTNTFMWLILLHQLANTLHASDDFVSSSYVYLYDLSTDPFELTNLYSTEDDYNQIVDEIEDRGAQFENYIVQPQLPDKTYVSVLNLISQKFFI